MDLITPLFDTQKKVTLLNFIHLHYWIVLRCGACLASIFAFLFLIMVDVDIEINSIERVHKCISEH